MNYIPTLVGYQYLEQQSLAKAISITIIIPILLLVYVDNLFTKHLESN